MFRLQHDATSTVLIHIVAYMYMESIGTSMVILYFCVLLKQTNVIPNTTFKLYIQCNSPTAFTETNACRYYIYSETHQMLVKVDKHVSPR